MALFMDVHNIEGGVSAEDVAGAHMGFRDELFEPSLDRLTIHLLSWEDALDGVSSRSVAPFADFYANCLKHNGVSHASR